MHPAAAESGHLSGGEQAGDRAGGSAEHAAGQVGLQPA
jgi:hypothetical protein